MRTRTCRARKQGTSLHSEKGEIALEKDARDLVGWIEARYRIKDPRVREAFLRVPREVFLSPHPELASSSYHQGAHWYDDVAWPIKANPQGQPLSSSTQPTLMAMMLDALEIPQAGKILEIGAGSAYNAILMACIAGAGGRVVSLDIEEDVLIKAQAVLAGLELPCPVHLLLRDASEGAPEFSPYDRIICTAATGCIPKPWVEQMESSGRMVVPLLFRGLNFVALLMQSKPRALRADPLFPCGFMPLRGPLYDESNQPVAIENLPGFLSRWPGMPLPASLRDSLGMQWNFAFYLACQSPSFRAAVEKVPHQSPKLPQTLAYGFFKEGDRFAAYQADSVRFSDPSLARSLLEWCTRWEEEGKPDLRMWSLSVHLEPGSGLFKVRDASRRVRA